MYVFNKKQPTYCHLRTNRDWGQGQEGEEAKDQIFNVRPGQTYTQMLFLYGGYLNRGIGMVIDSPGLF